jgi:phospholipase/carboxylesterase
MPTMRREELGGLTVRIVGDEQPAEGPTVVLMHGFGAPGNDLVPLANAIAAPPGTRFVFPEAPLLLPPELGGGAGRAWWMIDIMRLQWALLRGDAADLTREEPLGLAAARERVLALLEALEGAIGMKRERLVLGGFSQGAMLATDVALRSEAPLAALVIMSGTLLAEEVWTSKMASRAGLAVLQSHGEDDPLLPFMLAERLRDALQDAGLDVTWLPFRGGHGVPPQVLGKLAELLARL